MLRIIVALFRYLRTGRAQIKMYDLEDGHYVWLDCATWMKMLERRRYYLSIGMR